MLQQEFLTPHNLSARALADAIGVPANRLTEIIRGRRGVTADTAIRLGRYFGTTPQLWINMQAAYDLSVAENENDYSSVPHHQNA